MEKPLLVDDRKFDIRVFAMLSSINGVLLGYYYHEGYIRTASYEFDLDDIYDKEVHLTNDAVQKYAEDYGLYENGNKISYAEFAKYLDNRYGVSFKAEIFPQIRELVTDTFRAVAHKLDCARRLHGFEVFGYDFMIDQNFKVWLIEVNSNPCLDTS
jgi:hypothetical protein